MKEKITPSYYAVIPADVRYAKHLNANAKLLYGEITALCNKEGYCWASNNYFAELYGYTPQSISNWIQELVSQDFIRTENFPERGNLRHIYLNHSRNQQSFDFDSKTTIENGYIVSNEIGELSNSVIDPPKSVIELSNSVIDPPKSVIELSNSVISNNNTINNTINITSSSSGNNEPKPLTEQEIEEWIKLRYRHWFNRPDIHPIADIGAIHKEIIKTYTQDIKQDEVLKIIDRAFERVVQEKAKKDWVTKEVMIRIKWGLEDYFKTKSLAEAKAKREAVENLKPGDPSLWNPKQFSIVEEVFGKKETENDYKDSEDYRRKKNLFNKQLVMENNYGDNKF